jgi:hypothetical protein
MIKLYQNLKIYLLLIFTALCVFGCKNLNNLEKTSSPKALTNVGLVIQPFEKLPEDVDGCSCYFSENIKKFKEGKFIYLDDYSSLAYMRINNRLEKFTLSSREYPAKSADERKVWINDNFELILEQTEISQIDETWQQKGQMILKLKNGKEFRQIIYGECGC